MKKLSTNVTSIRQVIPKRIMTCSPDEFNSKVGYLELHNWVSEEDIYKRIYCTDISRFVRKITNLTKGSASGPFLERLDLEIIEKSRRTCSYRFYRIAPRYRSTANFIFTLIQQNNMHFSSRMELLESNAKKQENKSVEQTDKFQVIYQDLSKMALLDLEGTPSNCERNMTPDWLPITGRGVIVFRNIEHIRANLLDSLNKFILFRRIISCDYTLPTEFKIICEFSGSEPISLPIQVANHVLWAKTDVLKDFIQKLKEGDL